MGDFMKYMSIIFGKICIFLGNLLHRGSVLPGYVALKIDKNILKKIKLPDKIIAVTGSSGKGSTASMIANIFKNNGYRVTFNNKDSNLLDGITTAILNDCSLNGKLKSNVLIMEIDERYLKYLCKYIKPNVLVITNICRDQPPRQGHFDKVFDEINKAITNDITLVINGDDPYLRKFKSDKVIYYGIEKSKYSYTKNMFTNLNINYCPICNEKLEYNYYNFENNGDYYCSKCNFKRPSIDYKVTKIDYKNNKVKVNDKFDFNISFNILFCIYNTLAAFTVAMIYNLDTDKIINSINNTSRNKKMYNIYDYNDRIVTVLNNKNENSSTFNQSLLYISRFKELKTIIVGWNEISRRYNFDDLSWLYDIDFELLKKENVDKIICVGINRYDIAVRMKLAGIDESKIKVFENLETSTAYLKNKTKGNIYAVLNFDYVKPFNDYMLGSVTNDN